MNIVLERLEERTLLSAWFVSTRGKDANPGTRARPFATIQQAANMAQPGDTIFIFGGDYRQAVVPPRSGTAGSPITFRPVGNQRVTINGTDPLSALVQTSPGVYAGTVSGGLGEGNNQLFINGVALNEAQWPNVGPNSSGTITLPATETATGATVQPAVNGLATATLTAPDLSDPAGAWVGATIHIAPGQGWVFQTGTVIASSPGSITYTYEPLQPYSYQTPGAGNPFYLTGNITAFNDGGEWYLDSATNQLSLRYAGKKSPAVEMKNRLYAFDLSGLSDIHIENVRLFGCTINTDANSSNLLLSGLNAKYVSEATNEPSPWDDQDSPHTTGIILNGTGNVLTSSVIAFSSGDGVFLGGSSNTVMNCIIHDVDTDGADDAGVTSIGTNNQILYNTIYNCSRSGAVIRYSPMISVLNNRIFNCGLQTTDVGGIYTFGTDGQGSQIAYNVISDIRTGGFGGGGLYIDNGSSNYILDHNVVWNADYAVKINPPESGIDMYNNTLIGVTASIGQSGGDAMSGDAFFNNILTASNEIGAAAEQADNLLPPANPLFVNAMRNNYALTKKSPAINTGQAETPYTDGFKGATPDEGAYEFGVKPFRAGAKLHVTT